MGQPAARVGDMHVCPMVTPGMPPIPHVGGAILPPGVPTVMIGGMPAAVVGNMCMCVGPPDSTIKGSLGVFIGGMPALRMGDMTAHGGSIVMGCPTVLIGDIGGAASTTLALGAISIETPDTGTEETRRRMALAFYTDYTDPQWEQTKIKEHLEGIDFTKPVEIVKIPKGTPLSQWQAPEILGESNKGNYFAAKGISPIQLGTNPESADRFHADKQVNKVEKDYVAQSDLFALRSSAAGVKDIWSENIKGPDYENSFLIKGREVQTEGGSVQFFVPEKDIFQ
jgi:uncharacterized Zn-binding protein involved in type VI secretion